MHTALIDLLLPFVSNPAAIEHIKLRGNPQIRFAFVTLAPEARSTISTIINKLDRTFPFPGHGIITVKRWNDPTTKAAPAPPPSTSSSSSYVPPPALAQEALLPPSRRSTRAPDAIDDAQLLVSNLPADVTDSIVRGFVAQIVPPSAIRTVNIRPKWDKKLVAYVWIDTYFGERLLDPEHIASSLNGGTYFEHVISVISLIPPPGRSQSGRGRDEEAPERELDSSSSTSRRKRRSSVGNGRVSRSPSPYRNKRQARSKERQKSRSPSKQRGEDARDDANSRWAYPPRTEVDRGRLEREAMGRCQQHSESPSDFSSAASRMSEDGSSRRPLRPSNDRRAQDLPPPPPTRDPRIRPAAQGYLGEAPSSSYASLDQEKSVSSIASSHTSSDNPTLGETLPISSAFAVVASQTQFQSADLPISATDSITVTFGHLPKSVAARALSLPLAFADNPARQASYRFFLESQAGLSRDHYDKFLNLVKEFGDENLKFMQAANALHTATSQLAEIDELAENDSTVEAAVDGQMPDVPSVETETNPENEAKELGILGRLKWAFSFGT
ncbi:hypothetical protein P7C70_g2264, partial [Phenoliferia sp. Uapishka_3]